MYLSNFCISLVSTRLTESVLALTYLHFSPSQGISLTDEPTEIIILLVSYEFRGKDSEVIQEIKFITNL